MGLLFDGLLPASFRGVPFAVRSSEAPSYGRRVALHVYPGRDEPWAEDMGRAPRQFTLSGFIVSNDAIYFGGPIQLQRLAIIAAAEKSGPGTLTHPTLGVLNVVCLRARVGEQLDAGRMSDVSFDFVESGKRSFPSLLASSSGILSAATICKVALAVDLVGSVTRALAGGDRRQDGVAATENYAAAAVQAANDATALTKLTALLPGNYGRYSSGANTGYVGANASAYVSDTTVEALAADASAQRAAIAAAAATLTTTQAAVGAGATDSDVAAAIGILIDSLLAACADPADAIRLLSNLLAYQPPGRAAISRIGVAACQAFRRAIAAALAAAVAAYQPSSYDDAFALMANVATLLDDQATIAADAGDDQSFTALRALRAAVIQDLRARGATLARVRTYSFNAALPALVLAQRLYRDPSRADQLVTEGQPINPLFMPTTFQALAA